MSPLEPLALGFEALRRAALELRSPPGGRAWAGLALLLAALVLALAFAAHPAISGLFAGVLEASALPGVLRYPQHFEALPVLTRRAMGAAMLLLSPILAAHTMRCAHARWHGQPAPRLSEEIPHIPAILIVGLPLLFAIGALHAAMPLLEEVRLSSVTRRALPLVASLATWALQAAGAWLLPRVVLGRCSPLAAWREWPRQMARGLAPALVVTGSLGLLMAPLDRALDAAPAWIARGMPEAVIGWALLRVFGMVLASWMLAVSMALLHEAVPIAEDDA